MAEHTLHDIAATIGVLVIGMRVLGLRRERRKALAHFSDARRQPDPRVGRNRNNAVSPRINRANASGS